MKYYIILLLLAVSSLVNNCHGLSLSADQSVKESVEKQKEKEFETNVEALKKELMQGKLDAQRLSLQYFFDRLVSLRGVDQLPMFTAEQFELLSRLLKNYTEKFFEKAEKQLRKNRSHDDDDDDISRLLKNYAAKFFEKAEAQVKKNLSHDDDDDHEQSLKEEVEGVSAFLNLVVNGPLLISHTGLQPADIIRAEQLLAKFVSKFGFKGMDWIVRDGFNIIPVNMLVEDVPRSKEYLETATQFIVKGLSESGRIHEVRTCKASVRQDAGKNLYPAIQKVSNTFYTSKIPNKNLTLVMERVDERTQPLWLRYAEVQSHERVLGVGWDPKKGSRADGALHFKGVLNEISYSANEVWVAYITRAETPQPIPDEMKYYFWQESDSFAKDVEMFVTVTSSPNALITTHMGVTHTAEAAFQGRTKGISVDLHSFAAKVMLMRNPQRKYMVNAPNFAMEKIIADALPSAVFVGTREMQEKMKEAQKNITFDEFKAQKEAVILEELRREAAEQSVDEDSHFKRRLASYRKNGESEESSLHDAQECISTYAMVELKDGNVVVSEKKIAEKLSKKLPDEYKYHKNPYSFSGVKDQTQSTEAFLEFMKKHPPLLSVDDGKSIYKCFTIFNAEDLSKPWLTVDTTNANYQWMFTRICRPGGVTHYIVVDLKALADSRPIA